MRGMASKWSKTTVLASPPAAPAAPDPDLARFRALIDRAAPPGVRFGAILADPPWRYDDTGTRLAPKYPTLSVNQLMALGPDIRRRLASPAHLYVWATAPLLPEAIWVLRAWGGEYKSNLVWAKTSAAGRPKIGGGHYVRVAHEHVLFGCTEGAILTARDRGVPSWFAESPGVHSAKPEILQSFVERISPGPYLELFARRHRMGWTCVGDQLPVIGGADDRSR